MIIETNATWHFGQNVESISAIHAVMAKYYEGVNDAETNLLEEVFHSGWLMKDTDTPNAAMLYVESKPAFIERVAAHGPYEGYADGRQIVDISIANDKMAFVRVLKNSSEGVTCFTLFKLAGKWKIIDKVWVNVREKRSAFNTENQGAIEIPHLLNRYFTALSAHDTRSLNQILHETWERKYFSEDGSLGTENKHDFLRHVAQQGGPNKCVDFSRILSIETHHDGMAFVRIDEPPDTKSTFLTLLKVAGNWVFAHERWCEA